MTIQRFSSSYLFVNRRVTEIYWSINQYFAFIIFDVATNQQDYLSLIFCIKCKNVNSKM